MPGRATDRWDFRVSPEADVLVRQAAAIADRTLTDFVVEAAVAEAERLLADRTRFVLHDDHWTRFTELLDRDPIDNPALARLLARPGAFDSR